MLNWTYIFYVCIRIIWKQFNKTFLIIFYIKIINTCNQHSFRIYHKQADNKTLCCMFHIWQNENWPNYKDLQHWIHVLEKSKLYLEYLFCYKFKIKFRHLKLLRKGRANYKQFKTRAASRVTRINPTCCVPDQEAGTVLVRHSTVSACSQLAESVPSRYSQRAVSWQTL